MAMKGYPWKSFFLSLALAPLVISQPTLTPTPSTTLLPKSRPRTPNGSIVSLHDRSDGWPEDCTFQDSPSRADEDCHYLADLYGISFNDFVAWNPSVRDDCSSIEIGQSYCVERNYGISLVSTTTTASQTTTTGSSNGADSYVCATTTTPTNGVETPSPIQDKMVTDCNKFHQIKSTTTCASIEAYYNLPLATFLDWNPAVGETCASLLVGYYVCVGVNTPPTTAGSTMPTGGIETPVPVQDKMATNCNKFHQIKSTTTCASIENYYSLPLSTFLSWNPAVGSSCTALLVGYYVCVGVEDETPTTTQSPTNGISTPTPIQENMTTNCNKFHQIKSTTTCSSIENYYSLPFATFLSWNPAVGSGCTSLLVGYYVCVGVEDEAPISTPTPIQDKMIDKCQKFHLVKTTTTCASIQNYYSITMEQLVSWNPAIGSTCSGLWAHYYICVGV